MTSPDAVVLLFGGRRPPRGLRDLPVVTISESAQVDGVAEQAKRLVVVGADADLAVVLTRLLRVDRLDVEVAYVPRWKSAATRAYRLPTGRSAARKARDGQAHRVPLIRDETGRVIVGAALWVGETELEKGTKPAKLHGEAVVDDTVLFDGAVPAVRVEPTRALPGLRATVMGGHWRPQRWVAGRAAQLGTTGAFVARDGELAARPVRRSTFYRHIQGWLAVQ